jgi:hypothetical protein
MPTDADLAPHSDYRNLIGADVAADRGDIDPEAGGDLGERQQLPSFAHCLVQDQQLLLFVARLCFATAAGALRRLGG